MLAYLWVALGGALGSVGRFWLSGWIANRYGESLPWGTIGVNIVGSFVIGFFGAVASAEGRMNPQARIFATQFIMYGFCGGYTTFSSFSLQTLKLVRDGEWLYAGGNVILSLGLCLVAVWLGWLAGSMFNSLKGN
jgi:fluoride exporter